MFNPSDIMAAAWAKYRATRKWLKEESQPFSRRDFAMALRSAWADAKAMAQVLRVAALEEARAAQASAAPSAPAAARSAAIRAELQSMVYGDFIDWNAHRALSAELATIAR